MIHLNKEKIDSCASMKDFIDYIDSAYNVYEEGVFEMPTRTQMDNDGNTLIIMPCFLGNYIVTKLVTVYPENTHKQIPTIRGAVLINCNKTGEPLATLDGTYLTGVRTGAIGGNAIRHLSNKSVKNLAVIGAGTQGLYQTIAACEERDFKNVFVYNRTPGEKVNKFIKQLQDNLPKDTSIHVMDSPEDAIQHADVVITATTSKKPVIPNNSDLLKNKLFIGIGSFQPGMREFPEAGYKEISHLFIDTHDAIKESGDIIDPLQKGWIESSMIQPISSIIGKPNYNSQEKQKSILFKSTGSALFDAVASVEVYNSYMEK